MLTLAFETVGRPLAKTRIRLHNGSIVKVDGCSDDKMVLCEAWAHQGRPKSAQKGKVLTDAAKLFVAGQVVGAESHCLRRCRGRHVVQRKELDG